MTFLRCENLRKTFDGIVALDGVSLSIPPRKMAGNRIGQSIAIIGPNGAGKTTLLNVITGLLTPNEGRCFLGERELTHLPPHLIVRLGIARTFQDLRLIRRLSVLENVMLSRPNQSGEKVYRALTRVGVRAEERRNHEEVERILNLVGLTDHAKKSAGELSYGQKKLLTLACCLATEASVLLLDEPVAGVDPEMAQLILRLLRQLCDSGKLIVFIEHDMGSVRQLADVLYVMAEGRLIAQGTPDEVLERREIMEAFIA